MSEAETTVRPSLGASRDGRPAPPPAPGWRERWRRRPLGFELGTGIALLAAYVVVAVSAIVVFWSTLGALATNPAWVPPPPYFRATLGPSSAHPFGVLPGIGTDLFRAVWQATPWDLAIVAGILAFDVALGWLLGAAAGMSEGGALDLAVTFVGDTIGAVPSFFWVIVLAAGLVTIRAGALTIPAFVVLFGLVIWPATARTTRERARALAREPFLEAARASGARPSYLYFRHILPNSTSPLLAQLPIDVAPIFFVLVTFPWFWDCSGPNIDHAGGSTGIPPPYLLPSIPPFSPLPALNFPEWGNLLAVGACEGFPITTAGPVYLWMFLPPLVAIVGLGAAISLTCDGILRRRARHGETTGGRGPSRRPPRDRAGG